MALLFNGSTDYLDMGDVLDTSVGSPFTLMAWVRRAATGARHEIISKETGTTGYVLSVLNTNVAYFGVFNGSMPSCQGTTSLAAGTTYHVAGVYDTGANLLRVYVNGVQEGTTTPGSTGAANAASLNIGRRGSGADRYLNGYIEDARMYNRALSADELGTIVAAGGKDNIVYGLVGRWPMVENVPGSGGGATVNVVTGNNTTNGNTLTVSYTVPSTVTGAVLVVCASAESVPNPVGNALPTAATFNGNSMTLRASANTTTTAGAGSGIFTRAVSASESGNIVVTYTGTCEGRHLIAFVVTQASDSINASGSTFNNFGNATTGFTTTVANKLGIVLQTTGDTTATTGASGTGATLLSEVITNVTGVGSRVAIFQASSATTYSGYGFNFSGTPNRSSICAIALDVSSTPAPDLSGGGSHATIYGATYDENLVDTVE